MTTKCGWCITNDHDHCRKEIIYFDKTWLCDCTKCVTATKQNDEQKDTTDENPK